MLMHSLQCGWASDSGQFYTSHSGSLAEWVLATWGVLLLVKIRSFQRSHQVREALLKPLLASCPLKFHWTNSISMRQGGIFHPQCEGKNEHFLKNGSNYQIT